MKALFLSTGRVLREELILTKAFRSFFVNDNFYGAQNNLMRDKDDDIIQIFHSVSAESIRFYQNQNIFTFCMMKTLFLSDVGFHLPIS